MKFTSITVLFLSFLIVQGCGDKSRNDTNQIGSDIKRDLDNMGRAASDSVQDAADTTRDAAQNATDAAKDALD